MSAGVNAPQGMWEGFRQAALANLSDAFENVDCGLMTSIAEDLRARDRIYLVGAHASHYLVRYLHATAHMVLPGFRVAGRDGGIVMEDILDIERTHALICLAPTPPESAIVRVARLAQEQGALVIAITDSPDGPLSAHSDHVMVVPFRSSSFFSSHLGALAMMETLAGYIASGAEAESMDRIHRIEAIRRRLEAARDR